jgi:hypothetical protein
MPTRFNGRRDDAGYRHADYAASFAEFGTPVWLSGCGGWVLRRRIQGTAREDASGCYPLFVCGDWQAFGGDLRSLTGDLVTLTVVTDPFATAGAAELARTFDVVMPFKEHVVVDLRAPSAASSHHRKYAGRALRALTVDRCEQPLAHLDEWVALYGRLVRAHGIRGMRAFSRDSFARQLSAPGAVMFRASRDGSTVGLHVWFADGEFAYAHLGATSLEGRAVMAAYGLYAAAFEWFAPRVRWLSLGAAAGTIEPTGGDGLTFFKQGWSPLRSQVYICGKVLDAAAYAGLVDSAAADAPPYFPEYRRGEFD